MTPPPARPDAPVVGAGRLAPQAVLTRRTVVVAGGLAGLAAALGIDASACGSSSSTIKTVLDKHQQQVVVDATARLVPGPEDDPAEAGHPGAREANAAGYIADLLGALSVGPPRVWAGGPFSNRAGSPTDDMAHFLDLGPADRLIWQRQIASLVANYRDGIAALDHLAGGDFTTAAAASQDNALAKNPAVANLPSGMTGFTDLLFEHTVEACYGAPEYGGNANLSGWHDIRFPGDSQPRGYTAAEVTNSDGPDPYVPSPTASKVLAVLAATAPGAPSGVVIGPRS